MGGRLKKRGLDRDTVSVERALQGIGALETQVGGLSSSLGSNQSFDYEVREFNASPGSPLQIAVNNYQDTVPFKTTNAVIASCEDIHELISWSVSNGALLVNAINNGCQIRFLLF